MNTSNKTETSNDPFEQFHKWYNELLNTKVKEPSAVILATVGKNAAPSARTVLMKDYNENGFKFFTNYHSRKGKELEENPKAALVFYWDMLERQVRIEGEVEKVSPEVSDKYFNSRPKLSRISAVVSPQSQVVEKEVLKEKFEALTKKYADHDDVPRPEHWGGYLLKPVYFEFWQGRPNRLHDRIMYQMEEGAWKKYYLAP